MVETSHPRWPDTDPSSLPELKDYFISRFNYLFGNRKYIDDIHKVLTWMKKNSPELLTWEDADVFSTLFSPFHTGKPFLKKMLQQFDFPDDLKQFLQLCTNLEKTTDQFAYVGKMEELKNKDEIIENLETLLHIMPTQEQFTRLVQAISGRL